MGNRVMMTDANSIVTHYAYDALDRLSAVVENYTGGAQTSDRDVRTTYAYDPLGNRTVMTNARGYTTTYIYDALNRLSRVQDARGKATLTAYDAVGNRTVLSDANNKVTVYAYDALNRPTIITYTADATTVRYAYDALGNRTAMTDTIGTTRYTFDDLTRLTNVVDPYNQAVGYAYDAAGNRTHVIYPDGKVVTYTYNAAGLMTGVIDWAGQTTTYAYDAANRLITVTLPPSGSVRTVYTYDNANRLIHLSHTRLSDDTLLADYIFTLDKVGNRVQVSEAMEYPGDSQAAALPPTLADAIVEAITGHRAPGLSAPAMTGTLASLIPVHVPASVTPSSEIASSLEGASRNDVVMTGTLALPAPLMALNAKVSREPPSHRTVPTQWAPVWQAAADSEAIPTEMREIASSPSFDFATLRSGRVPRNDEVLAPLAGPGDIFADSFESGNFAAWSAAVTNTGQLSVTTTAARFGTYGMRAVITSVTALYVRDDRPANEPQYRARFYFHPNSIGMTSGNAHYILAGRTGSTDVVYVEFRYSTPNYQIRAQIRNDSTTYSSTSWYTISNAWHFLEIDWKAATAAGANNGYVTLWIDGALKQTVSGIDNDTRRVDEARLGPLSGIDSGTTGTELFDAFESRQSTYIGPVALADFTASPVIGIAPLTVTFTNTSQPTATLTAYRWNFGDGYTSTITNPVHSYAANGFYTVTLTAWNGGYSDTITKTNTITVAEVIFKDGFDTGNFVAWSAAITDVGRLSVTTAAAMSGTFGMQAVITSTTAKYVRDDSPLAETRYRARFYLNPNSYAVTGSDKTHAILVGRNISGTGVFTVQLRYTGSVHQIGAQLVNDATGLSNTNWYTISISKHPIEIDWKAATSAGANNGYLSLWLDGVLQETQSGIDNDTRRVDEVRLGPSSGIDSGSSGTVYYDTFESRRSTYIGPVGALAAFNANPVSGTAPLTVTFTNASQPSDAITAYLWKFGDGYTSTITNPVYSYFPGYYTVTMNAWSGTV